MLPRSIKSILLLLVLYSLCSCSAKTGYRKVTSSTERFTIAGVSILPPEGEGWSFNKEHQGSFHFGKLGTGKGQSIVGGVVLSKLPEINTDKEFLSLVSEQRRKDEGNPRYETILNTEKLSNERTDFCVRFHTVYKDFKAKNLPAEANYLIEEDIGMVCRHPYKKNIAVNLVFSQRTLENYKIENFEKLANDFIKKIEFIPFSKTNREIGLELVKNNQFELAIKHFSMAISEAPEDEQNYNSRGSAYEKLSEYTKALQDFNKALEINPNFASAYYNRGVVYSRLLKYDLALQDFNKAINLNPKDEWAYFNRSQIYQSQFRYFQAVEDLSRIIEFNPKSSIAHNNIGWIYATCENKKLRDGDKAVYHALKAVKLQASAGNLDTLGAAYVENNQSKKALEAYKKAVQNDKSFIERYQKSLKEKGCYSGPLNGSYSPSFENALRNCISKGDYL